MKEFKPILFAVGLTLGTIFLLFKVVPVNVRKIFVG